MAFLLFVAPLLGLPVGFFIGRIAASLWRWLAFTLAMLAPFAGGTAWLLHDSVPGRNVFAWWFTGMVMLAAPIGLWWLATVSGFIVGNARRKYPPA